MITTQSSVYDLPRLIESVRPFRVYHFDSLSSTNTLASEMRRRGEIFAPAIVLADHQTAGRGRGGHRWYSNSGAITATYVFAADLTLQAHQLPLVAGLAVRNAAAELSGNCEIGLKWPNDVTLGGRKIAGLLCERVAGVDLIGIGLNVNNSDFPPEVASIATSLATIGGRKLDLTSAIVLLTQHLRYYLMSRESRTFAAFLQEYRRHDALLGSTVTVSATGDTRDIRGTCEGVDAEGRLLVRSASSLQHVIAGTVRVN